MEINNTKSTGYSDTNESTRKNPDSTKHSAYSLWNKLLSFFQRKKSNIPLETNMENDVIDDPFKYAPIEEITQISQQRNEFIIGMPKELKNQISKLMRVFWYLGQGDGAIGQQQMPKSFFRKHAELIQDDFTTFLESKNTHLKVELATNTEIEQRRGKVLQRAEEYRDDIATRRQLYPRNYSRSLAWIYIGIAVLLVIADVPLALLVTQHAFNFPFAADDIHLINNIFARQDGCTESWPWHVWLVIANNWQIFFMTFGVALCTIYFKIFYDDFMGYPLDKTIRQFKLLNPNLSQKEEHELKIRYWLRLGFKTILLAFTFGTIVILGLLRAEQGKEIEPQQITSTQVQNFEAIQRQLGDTTSVLPIPQTPSTNKESLEEKKKWVYILLTILFPVIAGVCVSIGMGNIHNVKETKFAESHFNEKQEEHLKALETFRKVSEEQKYFEAYISKCIDEKFVTNYEDFFYNCYLHGYQRGVVQPDKDLDIYERARRLRDRLISTKSAEAVQRANESVKPILPFTKN